MEPESWKRLSGRCLVLDGSSVSVDGVVLDFLERGTDRPTAVGDIGSEEAGLPGKRCPSPWGAAFCTPRNPCHKYDYQKELSGRAKANKNFVHCVLLILLRIYIILEIIYHMCCLQL